MINKKCKAEGCLNEAGSRSQFCGVHRKGVPSFCRLCGAPIFIKARNYEISQSYRCRSCSSAIRISYLNMTSEKLVNIRSENMKRYNASPEGKINRERGLQALKQKRENASL